MNQSQLLRDKHALIFGAAGSIGSRIATEFAAEGAEVFISGRSNPRLDELEKQIRSDGGNAHVDIIDAEDEAAVDAYVDRVAKQAGSIDVVCNVVGPRVKDYGNGTQLTQLTVDQFMVPIRTYIKSEFITSRAAARHMVEQRSGVIIFITATPARGFTPGTTSIGVAFGILENFTRSLAWEVSRVGVRVVTVRASGMPDTRTIQETWAPTGSADQMAARLARLVDSTLLKKSSTVADTARTAVFVASDSAATLTGTTVNATAGAVPD
jgi:NAD(P)-dependent dehydrogenase (short-subunit alcohol dehydrogenase family)